MTFAKWAFAIVVAGIVIGSATAQDKGPAMAPKAQEIGGREPPPQAYTDCIGKKVGEAIQHTTREGKVAAICEDSPKGLVARPKQPGGPVTNAQGK